MGFLSISMQDRACAATCNPHESRSIFWSCMAEVPNLELLGKGTGDCFLVLAAVLAASLQQDAADGMAPPRPWNSWHDKGVQAGMEQQLLCRRWHMISQLAEGGPAQECPLASFATSAPLEVPPPSM